MTKGLMAIMTSSAYILGHYVYEPGMLLCHFQFMALLGWPQCYYSPVVITNFLRECSVRSPGAGGGRIRTPPLPGPASNAYAARILADVKNCLDVQLGDRDRSGGHPDPLRPSASTCETASHRRRSSRTEGEGVGDQESRGSDGMRQPPCTGGNTWSDENISSSRAPAHRQVPLAFF